MASTVDYIVLGEGEVKDFFYPAGMSDYKINNKEKDVRYKRENIYRKKNFP